MNDLIAGLRGAVAARDTAAREHGENVRALDLGREKLLAARAEQGRIAHEDSEAIARHARRLEVQTREGKTGPIPLLVPSDRHLAAEITARRTQEAAELLVKNLEAAVEQSTEDLRRTESVLHLARGPLVAIRVQELVNELKQLREREKQIVLLVSAIGSGDPGSGQLPGDALGQITYPPSRPTADSVFGTPFKTDLYEQARAHWDEYLDQLERAEPAPTSAPAKAA